MQNLLYSRVLYWLSVSLLLIPFNNILCLDNFHQRRIATNSQFRLQLLHRDLGNPRLAIGRSKSRLHFLEAFISYNNVTGSTASSLIDYQTPLFSANGAYLTTLTIGTPGVNFTALVDTGSDLVWRQCQPCKFCYSQDGPIFNPLASSTYKKALCGDSLCHGLPQFQCNLTCQYTYTYGDFSSTSGDLSYDVITLKDIYGKPWSIGNFAFGCGHDNEGSSFARAGGLLGLGGGPLSLISQLILQRFSYCLLPFGNTSSKTSPLFLGNSISLSGYNTQSTPMIANPSSHKTYYYVGLNGISVGNNPLNISSDAFSLKRDGSGGTVIDSGTTLTFLVGAAYKPLLNAFRANIQLPKADGSGVGLDLCYQRSGVVPSLIFHFDGADMVLPVHNYFINVGSLFCLAVTKSTDLSIIGNMQQQNFHILYDLASRKVSFTGAICDQL